MYCFSHQGEIQIDDPEEALRQFRQGNRLTDDAPQRIFINRFENDLENGLLAMYSIRPQLSDYELNQESDLNQSLALGLVSLGNFPVFLYNF